MKEKILSYFVILVIILSIMLSIYNIMYFKYLKSIIYATVTVLLIVVSIYFSIKLKFIQFNFKKIFTSLFKKTTGNISILESLSINLGAKIGVGSLSGIALSILLGGSGSIFWMWIITLITGIISYIEGYLGIKYQCKNNKNELIGGPSFYLSNVTKYKILPIMYSIILIIAYIFGFITIQSNTIVNSISYISNINKYFILIILVIITSLIIFKGLKKIAVFSAKIVPIMAILYILIGLYVIITNYKLIPIIISNIIANALNIKSIISSFIPMVIIGIERGIFATEIGLGTSAITSSMTNDTKENQGYVQLFSIYFTSFVICTITVFIILTSKIDTSNYININGIEYVIDSLIYHLGNYGVIVFVIITILFSFSTIIGGYTFGELALDFIIKNINNKIIVIFKIITILLVFIGGIINPNILWNTIDVLVVLLMLINLYGIYLNRNNIK